MPSHDSALPVRIAPPPPGWTGGRPARAERPGRRQRTRREVRQDRPTAAMVFGILSIFVNILLLPSLIGILYGARSLRVGTVHRGQAIAGIVCGSIGAAGSVLVVGLRIALLLLPTGPAGADVAASITASAARDGAALTSVVCPDAGDVRAGSAITCTGVADGLPVTIAVTFTDADGGLTWQVARSS